MQRIHPILFIIAALTLVQGGCASKPKQTGFLSDYSKLEMVSSTQMRYLAPDSELGRYSSYIIDPISVKMYDVQESSKLAAEDVQHLQGFLFKQLSQDLAAAGFQIVRDPGANVGRIRVAITNLKAGSPALNVLPQTKLTGLGLGQASAEAEIVDSVNGKQVAAAINSDTGSRFSLSGLSKWGDVEAVMKDWSKKIAARLSEARAKA